MDRFPHFHGTPPFEAKGRILFYKNWFDCNMLGPSVARHSEFPAEERLPAQKAGGRYKTIRTLALRFCRGLYVPCSSGRRGHVSAKIETLQRFSVLIRENLSLEEI